jgi:hypothetical protein
MSVLRIPCCAMTHADFALDRRRHQWVKEFPACELRKLQPGMASSYAAAHPWRRADAQDLELILALNFANYMFL